MGPSLTCVGRTDDGERLSRNAPESEYRLLNGPSGGPPGLVEPLPARPRPSQGRLANIQNRPAPEPSGISIAPWPRGAGC